MSNISPLLEPEPEPEPEQYLNIITKLFTGFL